MLANQKKTMWRDAINSNKENKPYRHSTTMSHWTFIFANGRHWTWSFVLYVFVVFCLYFNHFFCSLSFWLLLQCVKSLYNNNNNSSSRSSSSIGNVVVAKKCYWNWIMNMCGCKLAVTDWISGGAPSWTNSQIVALQSDWLNDTNIRASACYVRSMNEERVSERERGREIME